MLKYMMTIVLFALAAVAPAVAVDTLQVQTSDPILEDWRWTLFDKGDGLAGVVNIVYEDGDNIWFGTNAGVQKYDGVQWTTYTVDDGLVHNEVRAITRAHDGAMWFGTADGISRLSISEIGEQHWTTYTFDDGPNFVGVQGLCQARDGTIWAGFRASQDSTNTGAIRRFADGKWSIVVPIVKAPPRPRAPQGWRTIGWGTGIIQAADGAMLFNVDGGVLRFDGTDWTLTPLGLITHVMEASDGNIWATSFQGPSEVIQFDGQSWIHHPRSEIGIKNPVRCWETDDGTIWVSGSGQLSRFRDGHWFSYPRDELDQVRIHRGLPVSERAMWLWGGGSATRFNNDRDVAYFSHPDSLLVGPVGPDGSMWFRTPTAAVRLLNGIWLRYTAKDGALHGTVYSLTRSQDGSIWAIGTHRGLGAAARFHKGQWKVFTEEDGVIDTPKQMLATRDGSLWITGSHRDASAISHFNPSTPLGVDGKSWQQYGSDHGFSRAGIIGRAYERGAYEASDGTVWFVEHITSQLSFLHRFDPSAPAGQDWMRFTMSDSIGNTPVYGLGEWPKGTLWVGTFRGMQRIESSELPQNRTWWRKTDFGIRYGSKLHSFVPTEEGLWAIPFFRPVGALHFDGESWNFLKEKDGLPGNTIRRIFRASDGAVWFLGARGLSRLDSKTRGWTRFTSANGIRPLVAGYFIPNVTEDGNGTFWMDVDGVQVLRFRYHEPPVPETHLKPAVEQVSSAGNILVRWSGTTKWNQTAPEDLRYRWRLNGGDWTETEQTDITFTSLDPGAYQFEVYTISPAIRHDASPAIHAFVVEVPWWRNPYVIGLVVVFVSITGVQASRIVSSNRKLREANTALSDANRSLFEASREIQAATERKSAFLASMSHELRTPMNAIRGFTNLVIRRIGDTIPERQRENLVKVTQASDHLLAMINDLLDLSKIEAGHMDVNPESFSVQALVASCCATVSPLVEEKPNVRLEYEVAEGIGEAHTDQGRLRQMLINLLSNAIKFTDSGRVTVNVKQMDDQLVISVSDTGKGIPADEIDMIFDEYRQVEGADREHKGTGLGLSITRKFAELLGGSIGVESELGRGTTFAVQIPILYKEV